jgi:hypothetical protein
LTTQANGLAKGLSEEGYPLKKRAFHILLLMALACLAGGVLRAQEGPLSLDEVKVLLIGGANTQKMIGLIEKRGVDFAMNPDLAKQFHDLGAADEVIDALQRASQNRGRTPQASSPAPAKPAESAASASPPAAASAPASQPAETTTQPSASVESKVQQTLNEKDEVVGEDETPPAAGGAKSAASGAAPPASNKPLKDPSPDEIQHIIQEFAAKEKLFKEARDNYTYHQINKVEELGPNNEVVGTYRQDWDILFEDSGKRIEQVTYAPLPTLKGLMVTQQDIDAMRSIQPFVLTSDELPEYEIKYLGHVRVDYLTTYVFSIRPKEIKKNRLYFKGIVWVDDRDLQIVKTEGKSVPETQTRNGENLFPRFTTYREQIDGKYWFPTFTMADDTLYFPGNPVHIKEVIRYTNYKQFKSKVRILSATPTGDTSHPPKP